mgnify:CR=1 FL=1
MLDFVNDYSEGAHEKILQRLLETNMEKLSGYGTDQYCESAKQKIREVCECPEADIYFLVGGTQTNATVIDAILSQYEGVVAANTGHISTHEAGAIEASAHKVLAIPHKNGKITAKAVIPEPGSSAPLWLACVSNGISVGIGELISCTVLGVLLVKIIESNAALKKIFE